MFSYRHEFHAGNHADVLKHVVLIESLQYLMRKEAAVTVVDTHAGTGLYRLDGNFARKSRESTEGIAKLWNKYELPRALTNYLDAVHEFNSEGDLKSYPGSPLLMWQQLRAQDQLHLYELHPTDRDALCYTIDQLERNRNIQTHIADGFDGLKAHLPPPSRRGLVLMDPSYEVKTDYHKVEASIADALTRFATGVYLIWYPVIALPLAHQLPDKLRRLAENSGRAWLNTTLRIRSASADERGLTESGMFVINPPFALRTELKRNLTAMVTHLGQDSGAGFTLDFNEPRTEKEAE